MKDYKILIFDFDGTICDTATCIIETTQKTLQELGFGPIEDSEIQQCIGLPLTTTFEILLKKLGIDSDNGSDDTNCPCIDDELIEQCTSTYEKLFFDIQKRTVDIFPFVKDTLQYFHQKGKTITIASSRGHNSLVRLCERFDISEYVSKIMANEDVVNKKPAPEMVTETLSCLNFHADDALVIGDTTYDLQMGQGAGCDTCGVSYGNHTEEQLRSQQPTYLINNFALLKSIVG